MSDDDKLYVIVQVLREYSARPPLRFPNETDIPRIARKILEAARGPKSLWEKWTPDREELIRRIVEVWIPFEETISVLNRLPGAPLTKVDVEQRMLAVRDEQGAYHRGPSEELTEASFAAYYGEKANGTEFIAILGWLEEWTWGEENNLRRKRETERHKRIEQDKKNAEARLRSGADCPWTAAAGVADLHSRKNGRLFRLQTLTARTPLDPKFEVLEVKFLEDKRGVIIGRYRTRSDASKAVLEVAYNPDWR